MRSNVNDFESREARPRDPGGNGEPRNDPLFRGVDDRGGLRELKRPLEIPRSIAFRRQKDGRLYAITLQPTLFHEHALTIVRGSARSGVQTSIEEFVTADQLATRWRMLVARRRRHRYQEIPE